MEPLWTLINEPALRQGDLLPGCLIPEFPPDFDVAAKTAPVVDFRAIYGLPLGYLTRHAVQVGDRWRLRSPFLEHFSQAFARSFMRVGLPSSVPEF